MERVDDADKCPLAVLVKCSFVTCCLCLVTQAVSIFRSSECYSETGDRGTERQGLVYSAQWRNPYNLGTNLGYQSAVNYQLIVIKETKGYVCDETRQSIDGSPELFRVVDQQRYEKAS